MWDNLTPSAVSRQLEFVSFDEDLRQIDQVNQFQPKIDQLVSGYIIQAFGKLGFSSADLAKCADADHCPATLQEKNIPVPKRWWIQLLAQIVTANDGQAVNIDALTNELSSGLDFYHIELSLIRKVGEELSQLMASDGTSSIVQTLFADDLMSRWYTEGLTFRPFNSLAREALCVLLAASKDKTIRILEVGAGTGGMTKSILDLFDPNHTRYVFTDIGAYFLRAGKRQFSDFPFVEFSLLDLEQPCKDQGLEDNSFDLVIANNVIHDTKNIHFTLRNVQQVMAPGGMLLMLELTDPQVWWHMCFGSLDGWWRFKSDPTDAREELMLLKKDDWLQALADTGFDETFVLSDHLPREFANRVFLSQKSQD